MLMTVPSCWDSLQPVGWVERQRNPSSFAETRALSQIRREEKAAAADEVSPIVRHRASIARQKAMGFAEPVIGPARGPHRARAMGLPRFGPNPLAQPIIRAERAPLPAKCDSRNSVPVVAQRGQL